MEEKNVNMSTSGGTPASLRWTPTKEQISILEGLYSQGIRTPTAEQIQQITSRLKAFGHIEGKNVFYWFQNHKARQRQKQKQENMVFVNRFLHNSAPVFAAPPPPPTSCNVICSPFYLQRCSIGCYPPHPKIILPGSVRRRARTDKLERIKTSVGDGAGSEPARHKYEIMYTGDVNEENTNIINHNNPIAHETLPLFPLHPTGILEGRASRPFSATAAECSYPSSPSETSEVTEGSSDQPFFDFFCRE